ncbi:MAG: hypothetical protein GEU98_15290 [Pseudonocardiaceae bacterium]|nr:hypothetical protein [Pseudonocardiaceae bacterium]
MRIRTMAGLAVAGAAATAAIGGVGYAASDETNEPVARIVTESSQPGGTGDAADRDCPDGDGGTSTAEAGL